jgi:hypothetical protein
LGRTFTGWIAPAFGWRTTHSITSSARASHGRAVAQKERQVECSSASTDQ